MVWQQIHNKKLFENIKTTFGWKFLHTLIEPQVTIWMLEKLCPKKIYSLNYDNRIDSLWLSSFTGHALIKIGPAMKLKKLQ